MEARGINRRAQYPLSRALLTKILSKCNRPVDGCWEWKTPLKAYPLIGTGGRKSHKVYRVHCLLYRLVIGPIPKGMLVLHKCDNKLCVRPSHLELGTASKNIKDAWARGLRQYVYETSRWRHRSASLPPSSNPAQSK